MPSETILVSMRLIVATFLQLILAASFCNAAMPDPAGKTSQLQLILNLTTGDNLQLSKASGISWNRLDFRNEESHSVESSTTFLRESLDRNKLRVPLGMTIWGGVLTLAGSYAMVYAANLEEHVYKDVVLLYQTFGVLAIIGGLCLLIPGIVRLTKL